MMQSKCYCYEAGIFLFAAFQSLFVEHVLSKTWANAFQAGDVIRYFFDCLDLLFQVVGLQEIAKLFETRATPVS